VPDHSFADWTYDVSKQIGAFTITGLLAFVVAKRSNVGGWVSQVGWDEVVKVIASAATVVGVIVTIALSFRH
jgi:hypothetical protein